MNGTRARRRLNINIFRDVDEFKAWAVAHPFVFAGMAASAGAMSTWWYLDSLYNGGGVKAIVAAMLASVFAIGAVYVLYALFKNPTPTNASKDKDKEVGVCRSS